MRLEPDHVVAAGPAAASVVGRPFTRGSGGHRPCLVPGKMELPSGPWSVELALG